MWIREFAYQRIYASKGHCVQTALSAEHPQRRAKDWDRKKNTNGWHNDSRWTNWMFYPFDILASSKKLLDQNFA